MESLELTKLSVKTLDSKKANKIEVIKVGDLTILADYFIIASATNTTHVKALADEVEFKLKENNILPLRVEGYESANWIVLDYGSVVIHVFYEETRNFYNLEKLWSDGEKLNVEDFIK